MGKADWVPADLLEHILAALMPENALALRVSLATGLRINDVLSLRRKDIEKGRKCTIKEQKTGKSRRVYLPAALHEELLKNCGRWYVFEGRTDPTKHRTRQSVYKDLRRAAAAFRVPAALQISPHTARKIYAVDMFRRYGRLDRVQELLNHSSEAVTALYALSEAVYLRKTGGGALAPGRRGRSKRR